MNWQKRHPATMQTVDRCLPVFCLALIWKHTEFFKSKCDVFLPIFILLWIGPHFFS